LSRVAQIHHKAHSQSVSVYTVYASSREDVLSAISTSFVNGHAGIYAWLRQTCKRFAPRAITVRAAR
jgi:hypothetical protein